jgi:tripartite-type tricarboxylate transporter receptor subunit TctC
MRRVLLLGLILILFGLSAPYQAISAGYPEDGKVIRLIIPYGPGGGFDLYCRALQPFLKKYLPWKKGDIIIENDAGAGGVTGTRELYFAKPDGYTIGILQARAIIFPQMLGRVAKFDITKYTFLGQFSSSPNIMSTNGKHPFIKSFADLRKAPRTLTYAFPSLSVIGNYWILKQKVGLNIKPILGFKGAKEAELSVLRGEVDLTSADYSAIEGLVKSGDFQPLFHFGDKVTKEAPSTIPSLKDLGYEEVAGKSTVDRTIVGPPGIPKDRVDILRKAIWSALNDPQFVEKNLKAGRFLDVQTGEKAKENLTKMVNFWNQYEDQIKEEVAKVGIR